MHAKLITEENIPEIEQTVLPLQMYTSPVDLDMFAEHRGDWFIVTQYVSEYGEVADWKIIPKLVLDRSFEYDPVKIRTDWDQIVRK